MLCMQSKTKQYEKATLPILLGINPFPVEREGNRGAQRAIMAPENGDKAEQDEPAPAVLLRDEAGDAASPVSAKRGPPPASSPSKKKMKKKHMDPAVLEFRMTIQQCCKNNDLATALEAYERAERDQVRIEAVSFYSLLNLCDGLSDRGIHVGTPQTEKNDDNNNSDNSNQKCDPSSSTTPTDDAAPAAEIRSVDDTTRLQYAQRIQKRMNELHLALSENAYTALVRLYSRTGHMEQAEQLLEQAERTQQCKPRLRLYACLLTAYCHRRHSSHDDLVSAVRVWHRLSQQGLALTEKEYGTLLQCCVATGDATVLERVLTDLSEDVPVPARATTATIKEWFESPHASGKGEPSATAPILAQISSSTTATTMGPVVNPGAGWTISEACPVEAETGKLLSGCLQGEFLQPVELSRQAWEEMKSMNESIAVTGKVSENDPLVFQGGGKGRKRQVDGNALQERKRHWTAFQNDLEHRQRSGRPVDVLIDGANVGFFDQNFAGAPKHVDYGQIDWVVQHFLRQNKSVLLVMHSRHFSPRLMPASAQPILRRWLDAGVLYRTPPGMDDDWFWLHAALYFGPGTLVVTNDEMRDHHFQMVAPRSFLRWRDRHQVHFDFGAWEENSPDKNKKKVAKTGMSSPPRSSRSRKVLLTYPDRYSRRIQRIKDYGLVVPLPKRGDPNRFLDGTFVAKDEDVPVEETYLCIRAN